MPVYGPRAQWLNIGADSFNTVLRNVQRSFVSQMNLGEGIALNEALLENLFMILVSILNQIPIFVIGKPGSSKSLAMGLINVSCWISATVYMYMYVQRLDLHR